MPLSPSPLNNKRPRLDIGEENALPAKRPVACPLFPETEGYEGWNKEQWRLLSRLLIRQESFPSSRSFSFYEVTYDAQHNDYHIVDGEDFYVAEDGDNRLLFLHHKQDKKILIMTTQDYFTELSNNSVNDTLTALLLALGEHDATHLFKLSHYRQDGPNTFPQVILDDCKARLEQIYQNYIQAGEELLLFDDYPDGKTDLLAIQKQHIGDPMLSSASERLPAVPVIKDLSVSHDDYQREWPEFSTIDTEIRDSQSREPLFATLDISSIEAVATPDSNAPAEDKSVATPVSNAPAEDTAKSLQKFAPSIRSADTIGPIKLIKNGVNLSNYLVMSCLFPATIVNEKITTAAEYNIVRLPLDSNNLPVINHIQAELNDKIKELDSRMVSAYSKKNSQAAINTIKKEQSIINNIINQKATGHFVLFIYTSFEEGKWIGMTRVQLPCLMADKMLLYGDPSKQGILKSFIKQHLKEMLR